MHIKKKFGWVLLVFSVILIFWDFSFVQTGNFISNYLGDNFKFHHIFGLILLMLSLILLTKKEGLEYLVIPTGWEEPRIERAKEELDKGHVDKLVITGHVDKGKVRGSHRQRIYKEMRKYGIKPREMRILDGIDSEEDVLYLGRIVKSGDTIYFDTFPLHYQEYKRLINKAKRYDQFPRGVKIKNVKIRQGPKEIRYGLPGWLEEVFKRRKLYYKEKRHEKGLDKLKEKVKRLIS